MFDDLTNLQQYTPDTAQEQSAAQPQEETKQASQESQKELNFRQLRERADAAERRTQELERMVQMNMNAQQTNQQSDDDIDVNDDMYIEGKQFKKYIKNLKQELTSTKKQIEEFNQKSSMANAEVRLKSQFTDFDSVVTRENLEKLANQKPSLYRSIMSSPDIYDRGYSAYEMIKGSGLLVDEYEAQNRRLEENKAKPRAAANVSPQSGETPLARVGDYDRRILSESRKNELLRQVEQAKQYR